MIDSVVRQAVLLVPITYALGRTLLELLYINLCRNTGIALPESGKRVVQSLQPRRIFRVNGFVVAVSPSSLHFFAPLVLSRQAEDNSASRVSCTAAK
jgi:hypothetical protein